MYPLAKDTNTIGLTNQLIKDIIAQFKGTIYPDGGISIGYCPRKKKALSESRYDTDYEQQLDRYDYKINKYGRTEYKTETFFSQSVIPGRFDRAVEDSEYERSDLKSGSVFGKSVIPGRFTKGCESSQTKIPSRKYGRTGITKYGIKNVRNIAVLMQRQYGIGRLGFGTCTIPGLSGKFLEIASKHWSEITRRFYQSLKRKFEKSGAPIDYCGVTEIQPKRWRKRKEVALHLHFAYVCTSRKGGKFYVNAGEFRDIWRRAVANVLCIHAPEFASMQTQFGGSVHLEVVKKSVASYLGKYISKGVSFVKELISEGYVDWLPSQWWTASKVSKRKLKKAIVTISQDMARDMFYDSESWVDNYILIEYVDVFAEIGGKERRIGIAGRVTLNFYRFLYNIKMQNIEV